MQIGMKPVPLFGSKTQALKTLLDKLNPTQKANAQRILSQIPSSTLSDLASTFLYNDDYNQQQSIPAIEILSDECEEGRGESHLGSTPYAKATAKGKRSLSALISTHSLLEESEKHYYALKEIALALREVDRKINSGSADNLISYMEKVLSQEAKRRGITPTRVDTSTYR